MINTDKFLGRPQSAKRKVNIDKLMKSGAFVEYGAPDFMGFQLDAIPQYDGSQKTALPLPEAIARELKSMPPGEKLVIANTSERIIPTKPIYNNIIKQPIQITKQYAYGDKKLPDISEVKAKKIAAFNAAAGNNPTNAQTLDRQSLVVEKQTNMVIQRMDRSLNSIIRYLTQDVKNKKKEAGLIKNQELLRKKRDREAKIFGQKEIKDKQQSLFSTKKGKIAGAAGLGLLGAAALGGGAVDAVQNAFNEVKNFVGNTFLGNLLGIKNDEIPEGQTQPSADASGVKIDLNLGTPAAAASPSAAPGSPAPAAAAPASGGGATASPVQTSSAAASSSEDVAQATTEPKVQPDRNVEPVTASTAAATGSGSYGVGGPDDSDGMMSRSKSPSPNIQPVLASRLNNLSLNSRATDNYDTDSSQQAIIPMPIPSMVVPANTPSIPYGILPDAPSPDNINIYSMYITSQTNIIG